MGVVRWISRLLRRWDPTEPSVSISRPRPWLLLPPTLERGGGNATRFNYNFYNLTDNKLVRFHGDYDQSSNVVVGSSHGWLASYDSHSRDMLLSNPLTRRHVPLPSLRTLPVTEDKLWYLRGGGDVMDIHGKPVKIILTSCYPDSDEDCLAIMSFGVEERLAMCIPATCSEWSPVGSLWHSHEPRINDKLGPKVARCYEDFVYSSTRKHLYCVTQFVDLECWDVEEPLYPSLEWKICDKDLDHDPRNYPFAATTKEELKLKKWCRSVRYLVVAEKSNEVFLVRRCVEGSNYNKTVGFDVHKISESGELRYMDGTLDGMAVFIGSRSHSFVIESPKLMASLNLKPNSIYFTDPREPTPALPRNPLYGGTDVGVFDYKNKTFSPPWPGSLHRIMPQPMWFTPSPYPSPEAEAEAEAEN